MSIYPDIDEFGKNFDLNRPQLVVQTICSDLDTPVSAWLKCCQEEKYSFLLESVEGGATLGRYSVLGMKPDLFWKCENSISYSSKDSENWQKTELPPIQSLKTILNECFIPEFNQELPPMAHAGLFGYFGYEMISLIEKITFENNDHLNIPDALLFRPSIILIFDHVKNSIFIVRPVFLHSENTDQSHIHVYKQVSSDISGILNMLNKPVQNLKANSKLKTPLKIKPNIKKEDYFKSVEKAKSYIRKGDIFQVVPSQRFEADFDIPPFQLYRALRRINPSPFLFYLQLDEFTLVGSSPEILVRVRNNDVTIRPIAGTRKRGKTRAEDAELAQNLLNDPKEKAEHLMLLDLARNDVGKIAQTGSVKVSNEFSIEFYSHVMHIVSNVEGKLKDDTDPIDALFSGFPAGTVTGAPKIRAMEIIDELETCKRSFYAGCVGYLSGNGDLDTCITLRTALFKDNKIYIQAGGGVVYDSEPEFEYEESCNKAKAILHAAEIAIENKQLNH
jgi:anthranilate synthase component 1